jgi:hypothetical protein
MRFFRKQHTYPGVQGPVGIRQDASFNPPTGIAETLRAVFRGRVYEMSSDDQRRLRPTWTRSARAIKRERALAEQQAALRRSGGPLFVDDDGELEMEPPRAEILPPARRGGTSTPYDDGPDIIWPAGGGDGHRGV